MASLCLGAAASADVALPGIFADGMVLQRGNRTPIYGRAEPFEPVTVRFAGQTLKTTADRNGAWRVDLRGLKAGGPYELLVSGKNECLFRDVLVGEVWLCSGQSNMEWAAEWFSGRTFDLGETNLPNLRLTTVHHQVSTKAQLDAPYTSWAASNPENAAKFSLVGYLYGRELHKKLGVPVGLISSAWGGTPAESWTSPSTLSGSPVLKPIVDQFEESMRTYPARFAEYRRNLEAWQKKVLDVESDNAGQRSGWHLPGFSDADWRPIDLPSWFAADAAPDGATWVRREIQLPSDWKPEPVVLELGAIDDHDTTYLNGQSVGSLGPETADAWSKLRRYEIPAGVLKPGRNVIAVRVFDILGQGGFGGPADVMRLTGANTSIPLAGTWRMKVERAMTPQETSLMTAAPEPPVGDDHPWTPSGLYHGMIVPVAPYGIRGAIWYQGESNADRAVQYRTLFPAMIQDWRRLWQNPQMPFYFVQLANFMAPQIGPEESDWAELREAQAMTLALPGTGMAVAIDAGEAGDIHPIRKDLVADRLARVAFAKTYGQKVEFSGPVFSGLRINGNQCWISVKHGAGLKTADGSEPKAFQVAGPDRQWRMANARIEWGQIVVSHPNVLAPVAVRYAWANNPAVNVVNGAGLPMAPFRTDLWP